MITIGQEMVIFLMAVAAGAVVRLAYRGIVMFRKIFRHKMWVVNAEDLLFWTLTAVYLFVQIYQTSNGSIRWYFILGVVVGALISSIFIVKIENVLKKIYTLKTTKNPGKSCGENEKKI